MARYLINFAVFLAGLAVVGWVGAAYAGSNTLALAVTLLVGACYLAGALELQRYQRATGTLQSALAALTEAPSSLDNWLDRLHPSLRNAARLRIQGDRVAMPGPTLAPYLVGLLVLLGMLGTFLGMVATLRGTGLALESATDLQAIRASLAAPVKGLGFAFGTSVAGVATSAMLGLLSALCRRDRILAAQKLDAAIATTLRVYSNSSQREEAYKLLQRQAEVMPALVERLDAMMTAMTQHSQALNERLAAGQDAFHGKAEIAYSRLAASVDEAIKQSVAESARAAGAAIQPAVEATMAGLARETAAWHGTVTQAVTQQLDGLAARFESTTATVAELWDKALAGHQHTTEAMTRDLGITMDRYSATFEQRSATLLQGVAQQSAALLDTMSQRSAALLDGVSGHSTTLLDNVSGQADKLLGNVSDRADKLLEKVSERSDSLLGTLADRSADLLGNMSERSADLLGNVSQRSGDLLQSMSERAASLLDGVSGRLDAAVDQVSQTWNQALAQHQRVSEQMTRDNRESLAAVSAGFEQHAASLLATMDRAHADLQAELASRDAQRLAAWTETLATMGTTLGQEWEQAGARSASRQQEICDMLAGTVRDISAQTQAHTSHTIAEITRLVQAASEAPKAAAEVVAELREKLTDSMARDNAMLEERGRLLETVGTLLDAVNHASTEQRQAVDALVASSADLLERVGTGFTDKVHAETGKLADVAAQVTGSAVEVASLGEAFGAAVRMFAESNDTLLAQLKRIEAALDKSMTRSDEQLAYYVAQAREVVDLSMMSQKQILEDLQALASQRAAAGTEAT
jgi:hypothetical protein